MLFLFPLFLYGQIDKYIPKEVEKPLPQDLQGSSENSSCDDHVLVPEVKGVSLLGCTDLVKKKPPKTKGVHLHDLQPPGLPGELEKLVASCIIGRPLTKGGLSDLKQQIFKYYCKHDRPVVLILIPEQEISDGFLQIVIIESRVGKVIVKGQKKSSERHILKEIHLKSGDTIDTDRLMTDIAWLNQNPFHQTSAIFIPGQCHGTTDVELVTRDRFPLRVYAGADNTGNPLTGRTRLFTGANWGNAFNLNHIASFQFTTSDDFHKFKAYTGSYLIPLPWRNIFTVFGGYSRVNPRLPGGFKAKTAWSAQVSGRYKIPVGRTYGRLLQNVQVGYDFKETNNNAEFADTPQEAIETTLVQLGQFELGYHLSYFPRKHSVYFDLDLLFSPADRWFADQTPSKFNRLQPGASPIYAYVDLTLSDEYVFSCQEWRLFCQVRGQYASKILLPSEQFGLGGWDTVRGYIERIVNFDNAACLNFEIKTPSLQPFSFFTKKKINEAFYALFFVDYGWGTPHKLEHQKNTNLDPPSKNLVGIGPGLRYKIGSYLDARLDLGFHLTKISGNLNGPVLHFGVLVSY